MPFRKINSIEIKGDVKDVSIEQYYNDTFPTNNDVSTIENNNFDVPFTVKIPGGFSKNHILNIVGKTKMLPNQMTINLQDTAKVYPHPNIALHINPRFSHQGGKHVMCMNSWLNGKWCKEQRTDLETNHLSPGRQFKVTIETSSECYSISINDIFFSEFLYRYEPSMVNILNIFGDITLEKVWIAKKKFD